MLIFLRNEQLGAGLGRAWVGAPLGGGAAGRRCGSLSQGIPVEGGFPELGL